VGFGYNNFVSSGSIHDFNMFSTNPTDGPVADGVKGSPYTVSQLTAVAGNQPTFNIAIDVNTTDAHGETLSLFEVLLCTGAGGTNCSTTSVVDSFSSNVAQNIGFPSNNGNGFGDYLLSTVNLTGLASTALILFHAVWSNATDGAESCFIVGATPNVFVPLPPAALLFGSGLLGMAFLRRRRQKVQVSAAA
jgi:hypothetical protein